MNSDTPRLWSIYIPSTYRIPGGRSRYEEHCRWVGVADPPAPPATVVDIKKKTKDRRR